VTTRVIAVIDVRDGLWPSCCDAATDMWRALPSAESVVVYQTTLHALLDEHENAGAFSAPAKRIPVK
jgi:hypothetical protein